MRRSYLAIAAALIFSGGCYSPPEAGRLIMLRQYTIEQNPPETEKLPEEGSLTLNAAQKIALENNPSYLAVFHALRSAKLRCYQAWGAYSPDIGAAVAPGDQLFRTGGSTDNLFYNFTTVQASWVAFDGLVREFELAAAVHGETRQEFLNADQKRILLRGVGCAFLDVIDAKTQIAIAAANAEFLKLQLAEAEKKFCAGDIQRSDVLNFSAKLKQAEQSIVRAGQSFELAKTSLAVLMGRRSGCFPDNQEFEPTEDNAATDSLPVDYYLDCALNNRPDLNALREDLTIGKFAYYATFSSFMPQLQLYANYSNSVSDTSNSGNNPMFAGFTDQGNSFSYGALAYMDIFNGFRSFNQARAARAMLDAAWLNASGKWLAAVEEVRNAKINLDNARQLAKLTGESAVILREQRDLVAKEYRIGEVNIVRMNEAQTDFVVAEQTANSAATRAAKAWIELEAAAGLQPF
ncbi:MAG: TolC family protein [Victivallaceae bacterium]|nr:TolC family protein [Victivallaceae bacterium]